MARTEASADPRRSALTRDALEALFGIAWEGSAAELQHALRQQVDSLDAQAREHLLHGFLDVARLQGLFTDVASGEVPETVGMALDARQRGLVDAALTPLVQLYGDNAVEAAVHDLEPSQRAHLLLAAISREP